MTNASWFIIFSYDKSLNCYKIWCVKVVDTVFFRVQKSHYFFQGDYTDPSVQTPCFFLFCFFFSESLAHLPITRMQNCDHYRKSIKGVSGLAVEK